MVEEQTENTLTANTEAQNTQQVAAEDLNDFRANLPEEYRNKYVEFKTPEDFVKGYDNLARKLGEMTSIPKEDADREEWDKFFTKVGRPSDPEEYNVKAREELKDFIDEDILKEYKLKAFNLGLSDKQASELFNWNSEKSLKAVTFAEEQSEKQKAQALAELKFRWGAEYQDKLNSTAEFVKELTKRDVSEKIYNWQNDPDFIEIMYNLKSKYNSPHAMLKNAPASNVTSPATLRDEARAVRNDPNYRSSEALQTKLREIYKEIARVESGS